MRDLNYLKKKITSLIKIAWDLLYTVPHGDDRRLIIYTSQY